MRKSSIGALLGIMPWNYPYYQVARFAAPNLMIGNTIVLKHAPQCPESALAVQQIFRDAGLPADAYINVFATSEQVAGMIADPRISGVSVTGSEHASFSAVAAVAGEHLKKIVLELGGSDPFIVLDSADLAGVAKAAAAARMENGGQACNASKRMIVADGAYRGSFGISPRRWPVTSQEIQPILPLATARFPRSRRRGTWWIRSMMPATRARFCTSGGIVSISQGAFVEPTVLSGVTPGMRAYSEELFGPAAVVYRVADADEAVELANSSTYGLGGAVFSSDEALALDVADRLEVGMVWVNQPEGSGPELPFGGTKRSGDVRELGPLGIDEFVNKKLIHTAPDDD